MPQHQKVMLTDSILVTGFKNLKINVKKNEEKSLPFIQ
jgi:hypothetical protein